MALGLIAGGLAGSALGGYFGMRGASAQAGASIEGIERQIDFQRGAIADAVRTATESEKALVDAQNRGLEELASGFESKLGAIQTGAQEQLDIASRTAQDQLGFLGRGTDEAQRQLGEGTRYAEGALGKALEQQARADNANRLSTLLSDPGAALTNDPALRFIQEQGQRAIGASASVRGGRGGGRTMKELQDFGQRSASQFLQDRAQLAAQADAQDLAAAGRGFDAANLLAGLGNTNFGSAAGLSAALGRGGSDILGGLGDRSIGITGATADKLGQTAGEYGAAVGNALTGNSMDIAKLRLGALTGMPAVGSGVNFQAPAAFAGAGYDIFGQGFANLGSNLVNAGARNLGGR